MKNRLLAILATLRDFAVVGFVAALLVGGVCAINYAVSDPSPLWAHAIMPLSVDVPTPRAPVSAEPEEHQEGAPIASAALPAPPPEIAKADPVKVEAMKDYLLVAMKAWSPARTMPHKDIGHYDAIATDIASVVLSPSEPTLFVGDDDKHRTAILITTLAFFEGRFLTYVDNGDCNDRGWRKEAWKKKQIWAPNICDGGYAYTLWQIHDEGGIELSNGEWTYKFGSVKGADMVANRQLAVTTALHFVRKSLRVSHGLCGYTGDDGCSKATTRMRFAHAWLEHHPFAAPAPTVQE